MVARGHSLAHILDTLCRLVEEQAPDVLASILLLDPNGRQLRHGGAPSLPEAYIGAIDGGEIGPSVGSCGTAAYFGRQVIVSDIASDPLWANFRELALTHSLRACWSTPIFSAEGKVVGTFAMYYREPRTPSPRDQDIIGQITHLAGVAIQHKQAEDALQRSESYLAEAQRLTHTGSWVWRVAGKEALHLSDEWYRIYEFDPKSGMPDREQRLERIHPEDRARYVATIDRAVAENSDYDIELRLLVPGGTVKYVQSVGHPVLDASGNVLQFVGSTTDITERKLSEEALRRAQADLAYMNRVTTMGELAASLAHEIKQPIAAAVTDANTCLRWLTRDDPDVDEARQTAARMVKDATRAAEIISRIRLLFNKGSLERELLDVTELVREMVVLLQSEAMRHSISVRTELARDLPPILGDRVQLQQVIMNLITNGIDAMKDVDGMRELAIKAQRAESDKLLLFFSDTGVGLPPERDKIFHAFFTTKVYGTGMGLPSAGPLWNRMAAVCGPTITPRVGQVFISPCLRQSRPAMTSAGASTVFVVDDDADVRESIQGLLKSVGLRSQSYETPQEFLRSKQLDVPCCLVLDVRLPGINGLDLQRELADAGVPIPIIFITGHGDIP